MTGNRRENRRQPTLEELEKRTGKQRSGETEETEETKEQENKGTGKQRSGETEERGNRGNKGTGEQRNRETGNWEQGKHLINSQKQRSGKAAIQFSGI